MRSVDLILINYKTDLFNSKSIYNTNLQLVTRYIALLRIFFTYLYGTEQK